MHVACDATVASARREEQEVKNCGGTRVYLYYISMIGTLFVSVFNDTIEGRDEPRRGANDRSLFVFNDTVEGDGPRPGARKHKTF